MTRKFLLYLSFIPIWGVSQPCSYEIKETDDFMGTKRLSTEAQTVWSDENEALVFVLSNDNGKKALEIIHMQRGTGMMCFDEGSRIEILLESGDSIKLENISGPECADGVYSDLHQTMEHFLGAGFQIEGKEEKVLKTHAIKEIKVYFELPGFDDYILPEKVILHEKGFDLYGKQDFPAHKYFILTLPCID